MPGRPGSRPFSARNVLTAAPAPATCALRSIEGKRVTPAPVRTRTAARHAAAVTLPPGATGGRNCQHVRLPSTKPSVKMPTPVSPLELHKLLSGYDRELSDYLVGGFSTGFSLGCLDIPPPGGSIPNNRISARQHSDVVSNKIHMTICSAWQ